MLSKGSHSYTNSLHNHPYLPPPLLPILPIFIALYLPPPLPILPIFIAPPSFPTHSLPGVSAKWQTHVKWGEVRVQEIRCRACVIKGAVIVLQDVMDALPASRGPRLLPSPLPPLYWLFFLFLSFSLLVFHLFFFVYFFSDSLLALFFIISFFFFVGYCLFFFVSFSDSTLVAFLFLSFSLLVILFSSPSSSSPLYWRFFISIFFLSWLSFLFHLLLLLLLFVFPPTPLIPFFLHVISFLFSSFSFSSPFLFLIFIIV